MILKLYNFSGNPKVINKKLTLVKDVIGTFKNDTSINNPRFIIKLDKNLTFNYVSIEYFGRTYYYFVGDVIIVNDTFEIPCHIDVLKTFEKEIYKLSGIVERASDSRTLTRSELWNTGIEDNEVCTTNKTLTKIYPSNKNDRKNVYTADSYSNNYYLTTTN